MSETVPALILVVNDDEATRYMIRKVTERAGYRVLEASTGTEALRQARAARPDLVILDIKMPDLDGYEVCRALKADPETAGTSVLQTSATFVTSEKKILGLESGADGYLVQPFEGTELIATVRALLRAREAEDALRRKVETLADAERRKDEFLAMLAHELRNPLNALTTALHVQDQRGPHDPDNTRLRGAMNRQLRHLSRLVDDLLDISRVTRGRIELRKQRVNLVAAVRAAIESVAALVESRKQQVHLTVAPEVDDAMLHADPLRFEQIIVNLLTNASKYSDVATSIEVTVGVDEAGERREAVVRVRDQGIGIPTEMLGAVFDLFFQVDQSLARSRGGLGIGLTMVKSLVEMHGGTVKALSDGVGRGTEMVVRMPLEASTVPTAAAGDGQRNERPHDGTRVLVVEDNPDTADIMEMILKDWGYDTLRAGDGVTGLDLALRERPQIGLIDIGLPGIDGYQVAANIRASPMRGDMYLIAITGYGRPEDRSRALDAGFDAYVIKPVNPSELERLISAARRARTAQA